ncbi:two-component regulator propeller domain-containing protein [Tenacibaculum xiamenense]|uniref:two-component regulator propeller domain-containing protein n=1 Tax=Tenacibaculum xiamenense TaxID=1261553 RepID=UPI003894582C
MDFGKYKITILSCTLLLSFVAVIAQDNINFKHITPKFNNKSIFISQTAQDSFGNIWMNSQDGILKYNGYSYDFIEKEEFFPSIGDNEKLTEIKEDEYKNVWIKSGKGLLGKYNSEEGKFEDFSAKFKAPIDAIKPKGKEIWVVSTTGILQRYKNQKIETVANIPNLNGIDNKISGIEFVNKQELYISTTKGKIYSFSNVTKRLKELIGPFTDYPTHVLLKADNNNRLWIGTETGLLIYDLHKESFIHNNFFKNSPYNLSNRIFTTLFLDKEDNIWAGTDGDGLYKINSKTRKIEVYKKERANEFSLTSNTIVNINQDSRGNIWIVTKYGGFDIIPKQSKYINYHKGSNNNIPLRILCMYKSKNGDLWIGTDGNGITKINKNHNYPKQYFDTDNFYVQSITEDDNGNIWFGTYKNGLWFYNRHSNTFKNIPVVNSKNQKATDVRTVFKDSKGRIWVGSNTAINIFSSDQDLIASFCQNKNGLRGVIAESIIEDATNTIWIGVHKGGLFKFKENATIQHSSFVIYENKFDNNNNNPKVISMLIGKPNEIWFINGASKLNLFNTKTEEFENFDSLKSLKKATLMALANQDSNNIWMSSANGVHHFDRKNNLVRSFHTSDGFQSNSFMLRSSFKDKNGNIYFGTAKGLNFFDPKKVIKKNSKAKLFVNDIKVLNKPVKSILSDQITKDVNYLGKLDLKNDQSSFSVKFAAIGDVLNPNYSYTYKLNGFDKEFKTTISEGLATYTNVPAGKYVLEIKTNEINEGTLIDSRNIAINIDQPIWNKPMAYLFYLMLLSLLTYGITKWYFLRKKLLIFKISRRKENELHKAKMNFFAKMSHEIQTPITLILGPIEDMQKRAELNGNMLLKERLNIISNNANRLSRIARELTLTRNKELNKLNLAVTPNHLYENISKINLSFKELARSKKIDFSINCPKNLSNAWYDKEKIEHILYNLLSNAFKYTPSEGNVQLYVTPIKNKSMLQISITDSGPGITKEDLKDIFKIFYRCKNNTQINGAGIGLALVKELIILHKGKIKVKSSLGEGTTFIIKFPIAESSYSSSEKITSSETTEPLPTINETVVIQDEETHDNTKKTILIVEDNFELQHFLKNLLKSEYNILLAENGEEGFYYAKNNIPDLILSDIMMPEMDGITMSKELNKNKLTTHIPIILLTAKNSTKSKIEGLKTGAIEYINKPFNTNELLLKINNILVSKENVITKYRKEIINKPKVNINQSQDEKFLEKLASTVNKRLSDSSFKVDELTDIFNMSYSSLYRKCLSLTGLNLIEYLRLFRLKKAAVIIAKYGYNISETAYLVGFNDPKYFTKSFKKYFSLTPKEFKINALEHPENIEDYLKKFNIDINNIEKSS